MSSQIIVCIIIFALTLIVYGINKLSMGAVAMLSMSALILTGCLDAKSALANFANSNAVIMIGMFIVAAAFSRTQFVNKLSGLAYRAAGGDFYKCMRLLILIYFITIPFVASGLSRYIIFYPIIVATCERCGKSPSKALYPFAMLGMLGITRVPIGSWAVVHLKNNALLEQYGILDYAFKVTDHFVANAPGAIITLIYCLICGFRIAPEKPTAPIEMLDSRAQKERPALSPFQEFCGYAIFILVSVGVVVSGSIGVPEWLIVVIGAVLTLLTGIFNPKEIRQHIPLDMYLIFVGSLCLGGALLQTGAGDILGNAIIRIIGSSTNNYFICAVFSLIPFLMTQFMNNGACNEIVIPIVILACKALNCNPVGPIMLVTTACGASVFTPMASASIPLLMSTGGYDIKSLLKQGAIPVFLFSVVAIFWIGTMFPLW